MRPMHCRFPEHDFSTAAYRALSIFLIGPPNIVLLFKAWTALHFAGVIGGTFAFDRTKVRHVLFPLTSSNLKSCRL